MKSLDSKVDPVGRTGTTYASEEAPRQRAGVVYEEERAAEKPEASEEIVIEEINIDGMCGVY